MSVAFSWCSRIYDLSSRTLHSKPLAHFNVTGCWIVRVTSPFTFNSLIHYIISNFSPFPFDLLSFRSELSLTTQRTTSSDSDQYHMSDEMRWYMITFWILLIHSVSHFVLAAPVPVGEILEVRSNMVDVLRDGIAAWEKRMESDHGSTNEAHRKPEDDKQGSDSDGSYNEEDMSESESSAYLELMESDWDLGQTRTESGLNSEQMESDARGPDRYYNDPLGDDLYYDSDLGQGAKSDDSDSSDGNDNDSVHGSDSGYDGDSDSSDDSGSNDGNDNDPVHGSDKGYDGDSDNSDDSVHSEQASADNTSLGPKSEHPATPEHTTNLEKILLRLIRPRNSGSGAVGTPKRELQGTID